MLLYAGVYVDTADNDGRTALMMAAHNGHSQVIEVK